MPSKNAIKAINYIRNDRGELVPVFPMSTADNIYTDINKKTTVQDAIVGGKVDDGVYVYHNVYNDGISGSDSGILKLELPMGADDIDVDMNVIVTGMIDELNDDVVDNNLVGSFTRNTVNNKVYTSIAEDDYTGNIAFIAVYNDSGVNEYALFNLSNAKVIKRNDVVGLPSRPLQAKFDERNVFLVILCENHICVYMNISGTYHRIGVSGRNLETSSSTMTVNNIGLISTADTTYLVATSSTETDSMELYRLNSDGTITRSTDYTVTGGYYNDGEIFTKDMNIFIKRDAGTTNGRPTYTIDRLYPPANTTDTLTVAINIMTLPVHSFNLSKKDNKFMIQLIRTNVENPYVYTMAFTRSGAVTESEGYITIVDPVQCNGYTTAIDTVPNTVGNVIGYGTSLNSAYNGIYRGYTTTIPPIVVERVYNSRSNNITIDESFINAFTHPTNGYVYLILASNLFGLPVIPLNTRTEMGGSDIELTDTPTYPFPSNNATKVEVSCTGNSFAFMNGDSTSIHAYRRYDTTSRFVKVDIVDVTTGTNRTSTLNDFTFINGDYISVLYNTKLTDGTVYKTLKLFNTGTETNAVGTAIINRDIIGINEATELYASDVYDDNSPYGIIVSARATIVIDFTTATPTFNILDTPTETGVENVIFCRDTFASGFYRISSNRIERYRMNINADGTTSCALDHSITSADFDLSLIDTSNVILGSDNSTLIAKYADGSKIAIFNWQGSGVSTKVTQTIATIVGYDTFSGGHNYAYDKANNELVMILDKTIARFAISGNYLTYKGSYTNIPEISDSNIFSMCSSGNILLATTAFGSNTTSTGSYDYGMLLLATGRQTAVTEIRATGNLSTGGWTNYNINVNGIVRSDIVRLGYDSTTGKAILLLGDNETEWTDPRVQITYISYSGVGKKYTVPITTNYYANNYSIEIIDNLNDMMHLTTDETTDFAPYAQRIKTTIVALTPNMWTIGTNGVYVCRYNHPAISSNSTVNVNISDIQSLNIANIANMQSISVEYSGYVELYTTNLPLGNINVSFEILN